MPWAADAAVIPSSWAAACAAASAVPRPSTASPSASSVVARPHRCRHVSTAWLYAPCGLRPRVLGQGAQQQRIAAAEGVEAFRVGSAALRQLRDRVAAEPLQPDPYEVRLAQQLGGEVRVVAALVDGLGEHQQDPGRAGVPGQVQQIAAGQLVGPVHVVHADHHGRGGAEPVDGGAEALHRLDPFGGGPVRRIGAGQRARRGAQGQLAQHAQREVPLGLGADGAQEQRATGGGPFGESVGEFALSTADRARDKYDSGFSGNAVVESRIKLREFVGTGDQDHNFPHNPHSSSARKIPRQLEREMDP